MVVIKQPKTKEVVSTLLNPFIFFVAVIRIATGVYIFFNPLYGLLLSWVFDILDAPIFFHLVKTSVSTYTYIDKYLDLAMYVAMVFVGIRYGSFSLLFVLFIFKMIGNFLFSRTQNTFYFVLFPNFLEVGFIWTVLFKILAIPQLSFYLIILICLAEFRELYLHILFPNYVKKHGFPKIYGLLGIHGKPRW